ncbi:MAG: NAD(P)H-dependent glycerol-3-phosphate dehydrogenase [Schwartzia succinivorans]|nr:NAD(P)H-dependent glycerol-3-phosphate dehydrogenase [Schwartzia succinivorans]
MNISVLGCGRWGSFHAWYADKIGHDVVLWGRPGSKNLAELRDRHANEYLQMPESVELSDDLSYAVERADIIIISIGAQQLRSFAGQLAELPIKNKTFVLCMKGLEIGTGKRLSVVMREEVGPEPDIAVWVGPGHVQDFLKGIPNCMILASDSDEVTARLVPIFHGPLIRFYYGKDLLGTEIGAAAKNVVGLAAGMLDGVHYGSLKGALMARGTKELSRLIGAMGGDAMTVYGLSHLGDYEATLFSPHSNNRRYGENLMLGKPSTKLAEGVYTSEALMALSKEYGVELPISRSVYEIVCCHKEPKAELERLFLRSEKEE